MSAFYTPLHSTVSKLALDIAARMGLPAYEIDDVTAVSEALTSDRPAVLWQMVSVSESPRDPLWAVNFLIGAKTNVDVGNMVLSGIVEEVTTALSIGEEVEVVNYSTAGSSLEGRMTVIGCIVDPQEYERQAGVRMVSISAAVTRGF